MTERTKVVDLASRRPERVIHVVMGTPYSEPPHVRLVRNDEHQEPAGGPPAPRTGLWQRLRSLFGRTP